MSKKQTIDTSLPPTWEEMRAGSAVSTVGAGWSTTELMEAWGKNRARTLAMLGEQGWICVGRRQESAISGALKSVPIYAPPK